MFNNKSSSYVILIIFIFLVSITIKPSENDNAKTCNSPKKDKEIVWCLVVKNILKEERSSSPKDSPEYYLYKAERIVKQIIFMIEQVIYLYKIIKIIFKFRYVRCKSFLFNF